MPHEYPAGACLEPEVAARYLDGRLSQAEREAVEQHLVECDDCRELVTGSFAVRDLLDAEQGAPLARAHWGDGEAPAPGFGSRPATPLIKPWRRYSLAAGATVVGLAAALLLMVRFESPVLREVWNRLTGQAELQELVAAVGTTRPFAARPAGGFAYGPVHGPTRSADPTPHHAPDLILATARIEAAAERDQSQRMQALLGKARLMLGESTSAIDALEQAARAGPMTAVLANDLAAAFTVRGDQRGNRDDYTRALDYAQRAIALDPQLLEAWFNRALAAEQLRPPNEASQMWQDYVQRDPESPWANEARGHIRTLAGDR